MLLLVFGSGLILFAVSCRNCEVGELLTAFNERMAEVETYLDFLLVLETQAQRGPPKIDGAEHPISAQQQKILYSSVYLQLYNLIESTMTRCIESISEAAVANSWKPGDLCNSLRKEWVRYVARTHADLSPDHRLASALELCQQLVSALPVNQLTIEKGGGGNWDDSAIEAISERLGFQLVVSQPVYSAVKRRIRDDLGPLALVKALRNQLAHGSISFAECAEDVTVTQLIELKDKTCNYLREVVLQFCGYVERFEFLIPEKRPV
jgi:hypothetical protein